MTRIEKLRISVRALLSEVFLAFLDTGLDGGLARSPVGRANFAVLVRVLEGLHETKSLVDGTSDRKIVDGDLTQGALGVDDEQAAESDAFLLDENTVVAADLMVGVSEHGDLHLAKTALLAGLLNPGEVGELGVGGAGEELRADLGELVRSVGEGDDLSRADKCEVERIEEEHDVFALVVLQ